MQKLSSDELTRHLDVLPGWRLEGGALIKRYDFADFVRAIEFVNLIAQSAEAVQHHPDIDIRYNKVTLGLTTHDAGGVTHLDVQFAASADDASASLTDQATPASTTTP